MPQPRSHTLFHLWLLGLCVIGVGAYLIALGPELVGLHGLLLGPSFPLGGDFINLWSAARLMLTGHAEAIYHSARFMAFEHQLIPADLGQRLWVYPPPSLLFIWPLGMLPFVPALVVWSVSGIGILVLGARRIGFSWTETAVLAIGPAAMQCLYFGQTGNLMAGLMLLALAGSHQTDGAGAIAAGLLTLKPQTGFLLPLSWITERRWAQIAVTALLATGIAGLAVLLFGMNMWWAFFGDTLRQLSALELHGEGSFLDMIPSTFIAVRILTGNTALAELVHGAVALAAGVVLITCLVLVKSAERRAALVLIATALITPYLHNYDLGILAAGALLVARRVDWTQAPARTIATWVVATLAILLPHLVLALNGLGWPASPLIVAGLMALA